MLLPRGGAAAFFITHCMAWTNRRQDFCAQLRADVHHCLPAHEHQGSHAQICHCMQSVGTPRQRGEAVWAADASINAHLQVLMRGSERGEAAPVWHWALRWGQSSVRSQVGWAGTGAGARPRLTVQLRHLQKTCTLTSEAHPSVTQHVLQWQGCLALSSYCHETQPVVDYEVHALWGAASPGLFAAGQPALMLKQVYMYVREEARLAMSVRGPRLIISCMVARWLLKASLSDSSWRTCLAAAGLMTASP